MSTRAPERTRAPRPAPADPGGASRAVLLLGITLGTALVILAIWQGARPQLPGMPAFLGLITGVLLMWLSRASPWRRWRRISCACTTATWPRSPAVTASGPRWPLPGAQDAVTGP